MSAAWRRSALLFARRRMAFTPEGGGGRRRQRDGCKYSEVCAKPQRAASSANLRRYARCAARRSGARSQQHMAQQSLAGCPRYGDDVSLILIMARRAARATRHTRGYVICPAPRGYAPRCCRVYAARAANQRYHAQFLFCAVVLRAAVFTPTGG